MPRYRLLQPAVINGQLLDTGTVIGTAQHPFDGKPGIHMQPMDYEGRIALNAAMRERAPVDPALANGPIDTTVPGVAPGFAAQKEVK